MNKKLGIKIKALRSSLNLTMEDFGKLVGNSTKGSVHKWENNITKPSRQKLIKIAELANKTVNDFLNEESFELSIYEANYLYKTVRHKEKQINNIKNILKQYESFSEEELNSQVDLFEDLQKITHIEYKTKLIHELETLEKEYLTDLKSLTELQNDLLNSQKTKDLLQKDTHSLNMILNSSYTTMINDKILTAEDKKRALEILKLVFN